MQYLYNLLVLIYDLIVHLNAVLQFMHILMLQAWEGRGLGGVTPFPSGNKIGIMPAKPHNLLFLILFIFAEPTMDPSLLQNGSALFEKTINQNKFGMASMLQ